MTTATLTTIGTPMNTKSTTVDLVSLAKNFIAHTSNNVPSNSVWDNFQQLYFTDEFGKLDKKDN
ncbi:hypothetical protein [Leuconostoc suionicum]|uniref:hypothetical protein n=1 Tax=Leuconostoc suionicum TaxID=1511761 RepID=UPI0024ADAD31|nr:hypothetical protein [Leuconostoc suionicum]MDI6545764.1 hypothetical protein [Leuconostoc suionicum]MDI6682222.1 hypothetical protein [Leuconostoc suionicum]